MVLKALLFYLLNVFHYCGNINQYETRRERKERERREKGERREKEELYVYRVVKKCF
jgi:hypothetical protein